MNTLTLYNVDFNNTYDDVYDFATKADQSAFFASREIAGFGFDELSVIKGHELDRVGVYANYNTIQAANYAYFENEIDGVTRGYYAFVTDVIYAGIGVVKLNLKIDVWQTFMFDHTLLPSFVERAHCPMKYPAKNVKYLLTPEDVEVGDFYLYTSLGGIQNKIQRSIAFIWIVRTEALAGIEGQSLWDHHSTGVYIYCVPITYEADRTVTYTTGGKTYNFLSYDEIMTDFAKDPATIAIYATGNYPDANIALSISYEISGGNLKYAIGNNLKYTDKVFIIPYFSGNNLLGNVSVAFDDDEPKISCYPYSFIAIYKERGNEVIIKRENYQPLISNDNTVDVLYTLSIDTIAKEGVKIAPHLQTVYYTYPEVTYNAWMNIAQLPQLTDAWVNYMSTKKASFTAGLITNVAGNAIGGLDKRGAGQALFNIGNTLVQSYAQISDLMETPDSVKSPGNNAIFELLLHTVALTAYNVSIPPAQVAKLKNYFNIFGYTVRDIEQVMTNFTKCRTFWNYIETRNCHVSGDILEKYIDELQGIYNHGVRLWHWTTTNNLKIGEYERINASLL